MKHSHYHKPIPPGATHIDVYRLLLMFTVTDPCIQHAIKKLLVAGGRGGGKDAKRDVQEAIDSLERWQEMRAEEEPVAERPFSIPVLSEPSEGRRLLCYGRVAGCEAAGAEKPAACDCPVVNPASHVHA